MHQPRSLDHYRLLGRSGLRVSPLSLGTMTFGEAWGWGADAGEARRIFDAYADRGGNFIDTAVNYTNGGSERILGELVKDRRERFVLATKFTMARDADNINSGGNHRLNLIRSVETSLRQLATDRIDLLYLHAWDFTTAPDEVMRGLEHLVQAGKVLYLGICNTPAWRVAQLQTLADLRGWSPLVALQIEYSLVERSVEHELLPMARELGLGVLPWSPLGGGILTGKYSRADLTDDNAAEVSSSSKGVIASTGHLNARSLEIADVVGAVADELGASRSQVALAWTLRNPAVVSPVMGARTLQQAEDNFGALEIVLSDEHVARLDAVSAVPPIFPERFIGRPMAQQLIYGTHHVQLRT
ncbi:aldo/keto reductase [Xanthomonas phaseoli pv. phaseoli]|uniref:Aldo/keto reductase n=1 Tax=Xanthomonas campestris pv. phaseoli TaxID=317013 RepID=A0AB34QSN3_XANCH|nr:MULTISPECIES: aldo/keto reductase [Xanthomonas]ATS22423.1 aldo/keto reductase [Xanthomonas phaseoli pv. phaseoli]ATS25329.1 aldo/keto reductase [Xanthomonas phaseoli pv. phaseoli]ATS31151.1 aldo/keto reductase [Xanthomonas phaseoli pv. phaseoli]ATS33580.1 aldo/keto reductase [Xanthomonas phaseoli pv. phaseoli]AZU14516.1 aldo/keto reductase [Xanthomonas phaseoli pv. phaseoli]